MKINPQIFVVTKADTGTYNELKINTERKIDKKDNSRINTSRYLTRQEIINIDTTRILHNYHNISFDTVRKINNNIDKISVDTLRTVTSKNEVFYYSLYLQDTTNNTIIECVAFKYRDMLPYPDKYLAIKLDENYGISFAKETEDNIRYIPLAPVGSEYDSGGRYTDDKGNVWQICSQITYNLIDRYFCGCNNYFINCLSNDYLYTGLLSLFDIYRVKKDKNYVYLKMPHQNCGITKMFMIGLYLEVSYSIDGKNYITINTYNNGLCHTSNGGDDKHKANAMLIKLQPFAEYRFKILNKYGYNEYKSTDIVKNAIVLGRDVETLSEYSATYQPLLKTTYCMSNKEGRIISASNNTSPYYKYVKTLQEKWLKYTGSSYYYNYYKI